MDGVSDAGLRMQQIAAQLAALRAGSNPAVRAVPSSATSAATSTTTSGTLDGVGTGTTGSTDSGSTSGTTSSSFGAVLADALASRTSRATAATGSSASTTSGAAPAAAGAAASSAPASAAVAARSAFVQVTGTLSASGVASDLSHYENGRIPAALMKSLGTGDHKLWAPAADGFTAMKAAAARDGVRLGVNDSYRSYAEQVDMARRKGLYSQGGLAAKPGTSDHGWGKSVDLSLDSRALSWMRSHAKEYGFTANVPRESWHWTFQPK